jgi:hypothetical protein
MNEEIKRRWIEALRSGRYQQGTQYLRQGDWYCCLGVLCDLYATDEWTQHEGDDITDPYWYLDATDTLPEEVVDWAGLPDENPCVLVEMADGNTYPRDLGSLNDTGHSFRVIAALIEDQL